jgi:RNA polymerase sigma factor (sigma-70 family)
MKRFNHSRRDDDDEERDAPPGERSSGVRACGPRPLGEGPCTSFDEAYWRYWRAVWSSIRQKVSNVAAAEDIHQQVFLRLHRRIVADGMPDPLVPVLLGFITDETATAARRRRRHPEDDAPDSQIPTSKPDPEQLCSWAEHQAEEKRRVDAVLERMSGEQKALLELGQGEASSLKAAAAAAGIKDNTLRARLSRARAAFKKLYQSIYGPRRKP